MKDALALVAGGAIGIAAGLVGVGGGEFRIPALWFLLDRRVRAAAAVNLFVGTFTVVVSLARRWGSYTWTSGSVALVAVLVIASLLGGLLGALKANALPIGALRHIVQAYLIAVGAWMLYEAVSHTERVLFHPDGPMLLIVCGLIAFLVATFSAAVGVAGGELRIPAMLYVCAIPLKAAGTLSLIASLPTVVSGAIVYRKAGQLPPDALRFSLWMSAGSIVGVLYGAHFLGRISPHLLKGIFGAILIAAAIAIEAGGQIPGPNSSVDGQQGEAR